MLGAGETVIGQTERFVSDPECRGLYISRRAGAEPPNPATSSRRPGDLTPTSGLTADARLLAR